MSLRFAARALGAAALLTSCLAAQVIEFESAGMRFKALSRHGVTVMFAQMPIQLKLYQVLQVAVTNGSKQAFTVRPVDFYFQRADGSRLYATDARTVVDTLMAHATRGDVIKLISTYETTLAGMTQFRSTNGYEMRRQAAQAELGGNRLRAAATASAIAFVQTKLDPSESTDGAVFFFTDGKPLGSGRLIVRAASEIFDFDSESASSGKVLQRREPPTPETKP